MLHRRINIAIDGPAGAGKSTVAKRVADQLQYIYIDTGAMYRAVTLRCLQSGISPYDEEAVAQLAKSLHIELKKATNQQQVFVDGKDVTLAIRANEVSQQVSKYARISGLRTILVELQQKLAAAKGVVMDGRDIATNVLPDAEVKIYLTASSGERALRRMKELEASNAKIDFEQMKLEIEQRDQMDEQREVSPLRISADAVVIDSSHMSLSEVVNEVVSIVAAKLGE